MAVAVRAGGLPQSVVSRLLAVIRCFRRPRSWAALAHSHPAILTSSYIFEALMFGEDDGSSDTRCGRARRAGCFCFRGP